MPTRPSSSSLRPAAALALLCCAALAFAGCAPRNFAPRDRGPSAELNEPAGQGTKRDFEVNAGDRVLFDTDSSVLSPQARRTLDRQAEWIESHRPSSMVIEGHADERGTREYNLALGARRASAVRDYLESRGVDPASIRTISYGKERPVAVCSNPSCWSQNRRAVTVPRISGR